MKNILYILLSMFFAVSLMGCSEVDNLAGDGESAPFVRIFLFDAPANEDPDATVKLILVPNAPTEKFYVLIESKADKDNFIAANGTDAYADRVVANGTEYPAEETDIINNTLAGTYSITVVGVDVNGAKGKMDAVDFYGVAYEYVGDATYTNGVATALGHTAVNGTKRWYKSTNLDSPIYKLEDHIGTGYSIKVSWNASGTLTFHNGTAFTTAGYWTFPTPWTYGTYGAVTMLVDLDPTYSYYDAATNTIYMDTRGRVSAGNLTAWVATTIVLP